MKYNISDTITIVLILSAVLVTVLVFNKFFLEEADSKIISREIPEWEDIELNGFRLGDENAEIQIIEFFDYECPYCFEVNPTLNKLINKFPNEISIVFEHLPLESHDNAMEAALSAECARNQQKFYEFHNQLFQNQNKLNSLDYDSLALVIGIEDLKSFKKCRNNKEGLSIVESGIKLADSLGIGGVPTFLINNKVAPGVLSVSDFEKIFESENLLN